MIQYRLAVKMADTSMKITDKMMDIISTCTNAANDTIVSKREKRTFEVVGRKDEYTIFVTLTSRDPVIPSRSLSTLTRKVLENHYMSSILVGHTPNGCVFKATIESENQITITNKTDTEIVSEVVSIFFDRSLSPKAKDLSSDAAEKIREIVIQYLNDKNTI